MICFFKRISKIVKDHFLDELLYQKMMATLIVFSSTVFLDLIYVIRFYCDEHLPRQNVHKSSVCTHVLVVHGAGATDKMNCELEETHVVQAARKKACKMLNAAVLRLHRLTSNKHCAPGRNDYCFAINDAHMNTVFE